MKKQQSGFTLVEIAIVLVIIGLLLGGVLKGQELVNSAKVKNLVNDFRSAAAFVYAYQDRFRALPGDDAAASTNIAGSNATTPEVAATATKNVGNGRINGNWNSTATSDESYLFWQHVRLAGLASGNSTPTAPEYIPRNAEGGRLGVTGDAILTNPATPWPAGFFVCSGGINGRMARQIDSTMDDGNSQTGSVRAIANGAASQANAEAVAVGDEGKIYTVCAGY